MTWSSVLLDEAYTNALLVSGYNTGTIPSYTGGQSDYEREFLGKWADPEKAKNALNFLLLYGRLTLAPWFDNFEIPEDLPIELADSFLRKNPEMTCPVDPEEVAKKDIVYPAMSLLRSWDNDATEEKVRDSLEQSEFYSELLWRRFEGSTVQTLGNMIDKDKRPHIARKLKNLERRQEELEQVAAKVVPIYRALEEVHASTVLSENHGGPVLWSCNMAYERPLAPGDLDTENAVVGIYLEGLPAVSVDSLDDAMELLDHDAIAEFRNEVQTAVENLQQGKWTEETIDKRLKRALRALKLARLAAGTGTLVAFLSVPALWVPPLSAGLAATGLATVVGSSAARRSHKWALVGTKSAA